MDATWDIALYHLVRTQSMPRKATNGGNDQKLTKVAPRKSPPALRVDMWAV